MNLWIEGYSKNILIKPITIYVQGCVLKAEDYSGKKLGAEYKTEQRALEVLQEIKDRIINLQIYTRSEEIKPLHPFMECVFKLPKE